jgi:hypothetical protein
MKRARMYKKPGMYLSGPLLGAPRTYGAVADLKIVPSELLTSIPDIAFSCVFGSGWPLMVSITYPSDEPAADLMSS